MTAGYVGTLWWRRESGLIGIQHTLSSATGLSFSADTEQAAAPAQQPSSMPEADSRDAPPCAIPPTGVLPVTVCQAEEHSSASVVEDLTTVLGSKLKLEEAAVTAASVEEPERTDLQQLLLVCGQEVRIRRLLLTDIN